MKNNSVKLPDLRQKYVMMSELLNHGYGGNNATVELIIDAVTNCVLNALHPLANTRRIKSGADTLFCADDIVGYVAKNLDKEMESLYMGDSLSQLYRFYRGY